MPSRAQMDEATPLDAAGAAWLTAYVRASAIYKATPGAYPSLVTDLAALVGVDSIKSKQMDLLLDAIEELGDGMVGLRGGRYGLQFSTAEDREQLIGLVLCILYDVAVASMGGTQIGAASAKMNCPVGDCCNSCGQLWFLCGPGCLGYGVIY